MEFSASLNCSCFVFLMRWVEENTINGLLRAFFYVRAGIVNFEQFIEMPDNVN